MRFRSVDSPHYHIWTDALHARHLAQGTDNDWDRGSYVRWAVISAWTAFEAACEDAIGATGLGNRFKDGLIAAFDGKGIVRPDWGQGLWQDALRIYQLRKDYVHPGANQKRLFAPVAEADDAITVLRAAIKDVYQRAGHRVPEWPDDDENPLDLRATLGNLTVVSPGADGPDAVRITFVMRGKEYESELRPPGTDPQPLMERLLRNVRVPLSHVRAYRGSDLVEEWEVRMRGS